MMVTIGETTIGLIAVAAALLVGLWRIATAIEGDRVTTLRMPATIQINRESPQQVEQNEQVQPK